jgi:hypothetical protein
LVLLVDQVPGHDERVVASGREQATFMRRPLDAVEVALMAAEFEQSRSGLAHVEDADDVAVGGESGEHVRVEG